MREELYINMSSESERNVLWNALRNLRGDVRILITSARLHSTSQHRYYFAALVTSFRRYLAEQGEPVTVNLCHEMLKARFLKRTIFNPKTGEIIGDVVGSTSDLDVKEFSEYCENVTKFLTETFGIRIPSVHEFAGGGA